MKRRVVFLVGAAALLGGCVTSYTYEKPGASAEQVRADTKACGEYQLRRWIALGGDYVENMDRDEFERPCMEARGYKQVWTRN
jgi:hypothetical protein